MPILLFLILLIVPVVSIAAGPLYTWVELGPQSKIIARAIMPKNYACPPIKIDDQYDKMTLRARADKDFPVHSCEYQIPPKTQHVFIWGRELPLPSQQLERIVIIGDTGCRLKDREIQGCNNPKSWPFAQIAKNIAALKPDLVIHTGDYHYREVACPKWKKSCKGSPWGYGWKVWEADFFKPAKPLLAAAPWIMVRGNHEDCMRAGKGWRRFLDPNKLGASCPNYTSPYAINMDGQQFIVFDSAAASLFINKDQQRIYQTQFEIVKKLVRNDSPAWLLVHHPIWALYKTKVGPSISNTVSLQAAIGSGGLPASIDLIVSGHLHVAGWLRFKDRPLQLIVGNGGSKLIGHPMNFSSLKGSDVDGQAVEDAFSSGEFGYVLAKRQKDGTWAMTIHRVDGSVINQLPRLF